MNKTVLLICFIRSIFLEHFSKLTESFHKNKTHKSISKQRRRNSRQTANRIHKILFAAKSSSSRRDDQTKTPFITR